MSRRDAVTAAAAKDRGKGVVRAPVIAVQDNRPSGGRHDGASGRAQHDALD